MLSLVILSRIVQRRLHKQDLYELSVVIKAGIVQRGVSNCICFIYVGSQVQ